MGVWRDVESWMTLLDKAMEAIRTGGTVRFEVRLGELGTDRTETVGFACLGRISAPPVAREDARKVMARWLFEGEELTGSITYFRGGLSLRLTRDEGGLGVRTYAGIILGIQYIERLSVSIDNGGWEVVDL